MFTMLSTSRASKPRVQVEKMSLVSDSRLRICKSLSHMLSTRFKVRGDPALQLILKGSLGFPAPLMKVTCGQDFHTRFQGKTAPHSSRQLRPKIIAEATGIK